MIVYGKEPLTSDLRVGIASINDQFLTLMADFIGSERWFGKYERETWG